MCFFGDILITSYSDDCGSRNIFGGLGLFLGFCWSEFLFGLKRWFHWQELARFSDVGSWGSVVIVSGLLQVFMKFALKHAVLLNLSWHFMTAKVPVISDHFFFSKNQQQKAQIPHFLLEDISSGLNMCVFLSVEVCEVVYLQLTKFWKLNELIYIEFNSILLRHHLQLVAATRNSWLCFCTAAAVLATTLCLMFDCLKWPDSKYCFSPKVLRFCWIELKLVTVVTSND